MDLRQGRELEIESIEIEEAARRKGGANRLAIRKSNGDGMTTRIVELRRGF
jgi:hypothetical protein